MSDMEFIQTAVEPAEQAELIKELWYNEAALFKAAVRLIDRKQHLEHCDALLDAYANLGNLAVDNM